MRFLLTLGLASLLSFAQLQAVHRTPAKKVGKLQHHHSSSSSSSSSSSNDDVAFASAFNAATQTITGTSPVAVIFPSNQLRTPLHILHPVSGDFTKFQVVKAGTYEIGWTLTLQNAVLTTPTQNVTIQLFNATTSQPIPPNPFQVQTLNLADFETVSGQTIVFLPANTVIQLRVTPGLASGVNVSDATLFINRVDV